MERTIKKAVFEALAEYGVTHSIVGKQITYDEAVKLYLEDYCKANHSGYRNDVYNLMDFGSSYSGSISELTSHAIDCYVARLKRSGNSTGTINRKLSTIRHMLHKLKAWGYEVPEVHFQIKPTSFCAKVYTDEEIDRLLNSDFYLHDEYIDYDHLRKYVWLGYYTGLRKSEILALTWDRINLQERYMLYWSSKQKEYLRKILPLKLIDYLRREPNKKGYVVKYKNDRILDIKRSFHTLLKFEKIEKNGRNIHSLRHSYCTKLAKERTDPKTLQMITGHRSLETTLKYIVPDETYARQQVERL